MIAAKVARKVATQVATKLIDENVGVIDDSSPTIYNQRHRFGPPMMAQVASSAE